MLSLLSSTLDTLGTHHVLEVYCEGSIHLEFLTDPSISMQWGQSLPQHWQAVLLSHRHEHIGICILMSVLQSRYREIGLYALFCTPGHILRRAPSLADGAVRGSCAESASQPFPAACCCQTLQVRTALPCHIPLPMRASLAILPGYPTRRVWELASHYQVLTYSTLQQLIDRVTALRHEP